MSGCMLTLPKFMPVRVKSAAEQDSKAYLDLVAAYGSHSAEKLRKCIEQHAATFNAVRGCHRWISSCSGRWGGGPYGI